MDLGKYTDLPSALGFAPDKNAKISKSQLFEVFGKLPKFPTDFKLERGNSWVHDGVKITEINYKERSTAVTFPRISALSAGIGA